MMKIWALGNLSKRRMIRPLNRSLLKMFILFNFLKICKIILITY